MVLPQGGSTLTCHVPLAGRLRPKLPLVSAPEQPTWVWVRLLWAHTPIQVSRVLPTGVPAASTTVPVRFGTPAATVMVPSELSTLVPSIEADSSPVLSEFIVMST